MDIYCTCVSVFVSCGDKWEMLPFSFECFLRLSTDVWNRISSAGVFLHTVSDISVPELMQTVLFFLNIQREPQSAFLIYPIGKWLIWPKIHFCWAEKWQLSKAAFLVQFSPRRWHPRSCLFNWHEFGTFCPQAHPKHHCPCVCPHS